MKGIVSLAILAAATTAHGAITNSTVAANSVADVFSFIRTMGASIEGASVNRTGGLYAVNSTHFLSLKTGNTNPSSPILIGPGDKTSHFASSRFTRSHGVLVGDAAAHTIWRQSYNNELVRRSDGRFFRRSYSPLFTNDKLLQPNDFTINGAETYLYMSGMNYTATTVAGEHGDLWWYNFKTGVCTQVPKAVMKAAGIHRCNGIELSPDDKSLFLTSAQNLNDTVTSTKIFKFEIHPETGEPRNPKVVVDLYEALASVGVKAKEQGMDPDGMRMDVDGNLFITLNAIPGVLKCNTNVANEGVYIPLSTVAAPSNLEFGGDDGMTLYVVGRCQGLKTACVDAYKHNRMGRAISNLRRGLPPNPGGVVRNDTLPLPGYNGTMSDAEKKEIKRKLLEWIKLIEKYIDSWLNGR